MARYICVLLLLIWIPTACIDVIEFDVDTDQAKVSINGSINDQLQVQTIQIAWSSIIGEGNDNILRPILHADVGVMDQDGNRIPFVEVGDKGEYQAEMMAERGNTYIVDILLEDGQHIQSYPQTVPEPASIDSIRTEVRIEDYINNIGNFSTRELVYVYLDASWPNLSSKPFLRWRLTGEYEFHEAYPMNLSTKWCYVPENLDLNNIQVFDSREVNGTELSYQTVLTTAFNYRFAFMYCFHVYQLSINEEEYTYWKNIEAIINRSGSLYDPPPGTVRGNMFVVGDETQQVLGYFSVAASSYKRFFTNGDEMGLFMRNKCSSNPFRPQYQDCRDCLIIPGSTTERPEYWQF